MKRVLEYSGVAALTLLFLGLPVAVAGTIKTWNQGDTLRPTDLNANFAHLHNTMVGGHGARLVDADVNASAAIAHSKFATPALIPKAFARIDNVCTVAGACSVVVSSRVTGIARTASTGVYEVTLAYTPVNSSFSANSNNTAGAAYICTPRNFQTAAPQLQVLCFDAAGVAVDTGFHVTIFDNDN